MDQTTNNTMLQDGDSAVRLTDTDAAVAKLSAVQKGYLADPFIKNFVPRAQFQPPRPPLINIGTFIRTTALDDLVNQWLQFSEKEGIPCQIVSLGAGSDTRFWRIATGPYKSGLSKYVELDFPEVTIKKAMAIRKSKELSAVLQDVKLAQGGTTLGSSNYHLLPVDLRIPPTEILAPLLSSLLSSTAPTLLLCECVLVYMSPAVSSALIQWFRDFFAQGILGGVVYEMFGLRDSFGRVMVDNLKGRNVTLPGAEPYPDISSLPTRFLKLGFSMSQAHTLRQIRANYIEHTELDRISKLEMLDEIEELDLVLEHYAITWGLWQSGERPASWNDWGFQKRSSANENDEGEE